MALAAVRRKGFDYTWIYVPSSQIYKNWDTTASGQHGKSDCIRVHVATGLWSRANCSNTYWFLCQSYQFKYTSSSIPLMTPLMTINTDDEEHAKIFMGHGLEAVCLATIGTDMTVSWEYREGTKKILIRQGDPRMKSRVVFQKYRSSCQRTLVSCLGLDIPVESYVFNKSVACIVHGEDQTSKECSSLYSACKRAFFINEYSNHKPRLQVNYHRRGNVVHQGHSVLVQCDACVGIKGNISLRFRSRSRLIGGLSHLLTSSRFCDTIHVDPHFTKNTTSCGINVTFTVMLPVKADLMACEIRCSSFRQDTDSIEYNHMFSEWATFNVEYGPQKPTLYVYYHGLSGFVFLGSNVTANCTACVGTNSGITWKLLDANDNWLSEETLEELTLAEEVNTGTTGSDCGDLVESILTLNVTKALDQVRLVCFSYNEPYLEGIQISVSSLPFLISGTSTHERRPNYLEEIVPILAVLLPLFLVFFGFRLCSRKSYSKDKQVRSGGQLKGKQRVVTFNTRVSGQQPWRMLFLARSSMRIVGAPKGRKTMQPRRTSRRRGVRQLHTGKGRRKRGKTKLGKQVARKSGKRKRHKSSHQAVGISSRERTLRKSIYVPYAKTLDSTRDRPAQQERKSSMLSDSNNFHKAPRPAKISVDSIITHRTFRVSGRLSGILSVSMVPGEDMAGTVKPRKKSDRGVTSMTSLPQSLSSGPKGALIVPKAAPSDPKVGLLRMPAPK